MLARFLAQQHRGFFSRQAHAFQQEALLGQHAEVANRDQRILQVIKKPEAQNQIKFAQLQDCTFHNIALFERNVRESPPCLRHVFSARVEPTHIQATLHKSL